ncbi:hypothetical protein DMH17_15815 [Raoultella planticola]|nr:hypothetical protein [Raoultella planticola]
MKVLVIHYTADDFDVSGDPDGQSGQLPLSDPRAAAAVSGQTADLATGAGTRFGPACRISFWRGSTRINDTSIGIELENRGWQKSVGKSFTPFNPAQINALIPLAKDIISRYHIAPQNVVAHADIAPAA